MRFRFPFSHLLSLLDSPIAQLTTKTENYSLTHTRRRKRRRRVTLKYQNMRKKDFENKKR